MERRAPTLETENLIVQSFPLAHQNGLGEMEKLGILTLQANKLDIRATARRRVVALITIAIMPTLFVTILIMRQFKSDVLVPLVRVAETLRRSPQNWIDLQIDLDHRQDDRNKDELDDLVDSIHEMRNQIFSVKGDMELGEKRLAHAAHLARLAPSTIDSTMEKILYCDEKYAALHRKTVAEMLHLNFKMDIVEKLLNEKTRALAVDVKNRILKGSSEIQTYKIRFDDGEFIYLRQYFVGIYDNVGALTAVHVIAQDVTNDVLNQDMLLQSQKNEAIGKLTAGVAHDFNIILAVIAGNLELTLSNSDNARVISYSKNAMGTVD
jgi:hypothetical protein